MQMNWRLLKTFDFVNDANKSIETILLVSGETKASTENQWNEETEEKARVFLRLKLNLNLILQNDHTIQATLK